MGKKIGTTESFIRKARQVHGDKYDYSEVEYGKNQYEKVIIICPIHGRFEQTPSGHLSGKECKYCKLNIKKTTENFIKNAIEIHGDNYDYSETVYVNAKTDVIIICTKHGKFEQLPDVHLRGCGCPRCAGKYRTTESFIEEIKDIYGDKYDCSNVVYVNSKTKVHLICLEHGDFYIKSGHLLAGHGCVRCGNTKIKYIDYEDAKEIVQPHMKSLSKSLGRKVVISDYYQWWDDNKDYCNKMNIPKKADNYYKYHNIKSK